MIKTLGLWLSISLALTSASGAWAAPIPASGANTASSGNFAVIQIATTDPDQLMGDWNKATPGVSLTTMTSMVRHQPIVTFIIFKGCQADAAGNCDVTVDFNTTGPAGKLVNDTKGVQVWVGHPPPPGLELQLSVAGYGISFDEAEALGPYRVRATVTDHVSGASLSTEQVLTLQAK